MASVPPLKTHSLGRDALPLYVSRNQENVNHASEATQDSSEATKDNPRRRASRRASRPNRRRSLLDEIAAEKNLAYVDESVIVDGAEKQPSASGSRSTNIRTNPRPKPGLLRTSLEGLIAEEELPEQNSESFHNENGSDQTGSLGSSMVTSPITISSHIDGSSPISGQYGEPGLSDNKASSLSLRVKGRLNDHSLPGPYSRRIRQRSSTRDTSMSWSPASVFLAQLNRDDKASTAEPDDEGQELGDNGEYIIGKQIGFGGFSVVKELQSYNQGEIVTRAVKIVRKRVNGQSEDDDERRQVRFEHEVGIWRYLKHPNVLPLLSVYETDFATFCITELNTGGTLFDLVAHHRRLAPGLTVKTSMRSQSSDAQADQAALQPRTMPITLARRYIQQLADALAYLHRIVRLVHRDVKLENCLINTTLDHSEPTTPQSRGRDARPTESNPGNLLLCDFGMAEFMAKDDRDPRLSDDDLVAQMHSSTATDGRMDGMPLTTSATPTDMAGPNPKATFSLGVDGSLHYAAPEVFKAPAPIYEPSADIWAFGVTVYAILSGDLPFTHDLPEKLASLIIEGKWDEGRVVESLTRHLQVDGLISAARGNESDPPVIAHALKLLKGCLDVDQHQRWDVADILESDFVKG